MKRGIKTVIGFLFIIVYIVVSVLWCSVGIAPVSATVWSNATMIILIVVCLFFGAPWCDIRIQPVKIPRHLMLYIFALTLVTWLATQSISLWFVDNGLYDAGNGGTDTNMLMYIFLSVIAAPFAEELLMRGILFNNISSDFGLIAGYVISSFVFAGLHGTIIHLITAFICGLLFAYVYAATGSLLYSMVVHATYNALSIITTGMAVPSVFGSLGVVIALTCLSIGGLVFGIAVDMRSKPRFDLRATK